MTPNIKLLLVLLSKIESNRELFDVLAEFIIDDEKNRRVIEVTLAAADYTKFVRLMKLRAKRLCHSKFVKPRSTSGINEFPSFLAINHFNLSQIFFLSLSLSQRYKK